MKTSVLGVLTLLAAALIDSNSSRYGVRFCLRTLRSVVPESGVRS